MDLRPGMRMTGLPVDAAFIGSCTTSRLFDLRRAAPLLRGRKVAPGVKAICVPGSTEVRARAEAAGIDRVLPDTGLEWRGAGRLRCLYAGGSRFWTAYRASISTTPTLQ